VTADSYRAVLIGAQLLLLAWIVLHDLRTLIVPNRYVYPAIAGSLLLILPLGLGAMSSVWLGALAAFAVMVLMAIISRGAMGLGDTKVGAYCGAIVGLQGVAPMLMFTFLGGGLISLGLIATRIRRRSDAIAFTPFMLVAVVATLWLAGVSA
jgi:leader peptidase (prepilin peptidase)/N-methyltransferase